MSKLSAKEQDLLQRVDEKEELRPLFFRKVKGLKWFDALAERGYFNPDKIPEPVPSKEEGYVNIPFWSVVDYLVKTAPELTEEKNGEYARKFLQVLVDVTIYAKENEISNYRTWWQFAEVISHIPYSVIDIERIDIVDYWLDDKYERNLVSQEIGMKWLPKLLELNDKYALQIAIRIIEILYKVIFVKSKYGDRDKQDASLRFDYYYAQKITAKVSSLAGEKLGIDAVQIFETKLKYILEKLDRDSWSSIWQPAIEEHEQNEHRDDAENILIQAYRDSLITFIKVNPDRATEYVVNMLGSEYQTVHRVAIFVISRNFHLFTRVIDRLLENKYFESNYRHEMWHLLNRNYQQFSEQQKEKVIILISEITREDDDGKYHAGATAYNRAIWLSAIKDHGEKESQLYEEYINIANAEPDNPDFSSYMSVGWGGPKSPRSLEDLQALSIGGLIQQLVEYKKPGGFDEPGLEGLVKTFKQLIKTEPLKYYLHFGKFINLDLAYSHEIIEAYRELWDEKSQLPWDEIWQKLLEFCQSVITLERFWDPENAKQREPFVANRYWIVSDIGRLIEAGTKSDEHAFNEELLNNAEEIILYLLNREEGEEFTVDSDAVFKSINSPRGHCLEALINLTLRSCRIADKKNNKDHSETWLHFHQFYDLELDRADAEKPEYEFATLVTNYLPNFHYMSKNWVLDNLNRIFDQGNYIKWLCAMQGYAYVGRIYREIYDYLKENGDFFKLLDDTNIKDRVVERVIQNIVIGYLDDFEDFEEENSLINTLFTRNNYEEINHLIWFIWTIRRKEDERLKNKIYKLWSKVLENIDLSTKEGQRQASQLCFWSVYIDHIDDENRDYLLTIAPYSEVAYNSYILLESLAEISQKQPFDAHAIWMKMLAESSPDYPEEAVRKLFTSLLREGHEGLRKAREAESEYIKKGNDRPSLWLRELREEMGI